MDFFAKSNKSLASFNEFEIGFSIKIGIFFSINFFACEACSGVGVAITAPSIFSVLNISSIEPKNLHLKNLSH